MVTERYHCDYCSSNFRTRELAEEHEEWPIVTLPRGLIYSSERMSRKGKVTENERYYRVVTGEKTEYSLSHNHDRPWEVIELTPLGRRVRIRTNEVNGIFIQKSLENNVSYREEIRDVASLLTHKKVRRALLEKGVDKLILDLEEKTTFLVVE
jgi:hypothetical protein